MLCCVSCGVLCCTVGPPGWYNLGLARKAQGHTEEGEKHLFTAVTLAAAAPVMSYSKLPLML